MESKNLNISLIKELLYLEIKDYYDKINKQKDLQSNISMLEEMIKILESENYEYMKENYILFDSIIPIFFSTTKETSQNILNSLYKAIYNSNSYTNNPEKYLKSDLDKGKKYIKNLINKLNTILEQLQAELVFTKPIISDQIMQEYKLIIHNLKFNQKITSGDYKILLELFKRKNLEEKEIILLLEKVKNHNIRSHIDINKKINYNKLNEITNIILSGFEEFEDITWLEDKRKSQIDSLINVIMHQGIDENITPELLPKYKGNLTFSENYSLNSVRYLYISLLKHYQEELLEVYKELNNLEHYEDKEYRNTLLTLYKEALQNYIFIRKIMDNEIEKYNQDIKTIEEKEEDTNILHYGLKKSGISYLESDLKDIPKDTYNSVKELLMLFRKNRLFPSQTKPLNEAYPGISEIRDDQIRITYKHLKDNEYVLLGVFIKKDDNPIKQYKIYCNRTPISIINSKDVEEEIFSSLSHHSGGRRNS